MTRDGGRGSGRASGAGSSPVGDAGGLQDHDDDPELDEILAAFQRRPRASGAVVALSELVAEPAPLGSEPTGREGETFLLPRTRDRQRRQARKATAAAAILTVAAAVALWLALRPRAHPVSVRSDGTASSESRSLSTAGPAVETPPSTALPAASVSGSAARPAAKVPRVPTAPPPIPNLDPELKRSM